MTDGAFPPYAHRLGTTPHPRRDPRGHSYGRPEPERRPFDPSQARSDAEWNRAIEFFDAGYHWEAHELFEALWRGTEAPPVRALLRGLVQLCALELAIAAKKPDGAVAIGRRASKSLGEAAIAVETGLDLPRIAADAERRSGGSMPMRLLGADSVARSRPRPYLSGMAVQRIEIDEDITQAKTLPGSFYVDPLRFDRARELVFARSWQYAVDARELDTPGSIRPHVLLPGILDEPLVFTRDESGALHALSNVCTHRANLIVDSAGCSRALVCRYHGRRFDLSGRMLSMPCFEGVKDFPSPADDLARVPIARLGPLAFVSAAPEHAFDRLITPVLDRVGWLPLDEFAPAPERSRDYEFDAHWALYCDNYLEGFHIPFLHGGLNSVIEFESYTTELFEFATLQIARSKPGEPAFELPASSPEHGERIGAYYFWLWPNLMLNFYPWGLSLNHVTPLGPARTRVVFRTFVWKPELLGRGAGSGLHTVELEDEAAVTAVQRGVRSRFYSAGRYSPEQERGVHHFHRMLAERLG